MQYVDGPLKGPCSSRTRCHNGTSGTSSFQSKLSIALLGAQNRQDATPEAKNVLGRRDGDHEWRYQQVAPTEIILVPGLQDPAHAGSFQDEKGS